MSYPQYPPGGYQAGRPVMPPAMPRRPGTVLAGVILTYVGAGVMLTAGLMMLLGPIRGNFVIENVAFPASALSVTGWIFTVLGVLLVVLGVLTQLGRGAARIVLTVIGGLSVAAHLYGLTLGTAVPFIGAAWIVLAVVLMWMGSANAWFRARATRTGPPTQHGGGYPRHP